MIHTTPSTELTVRLNERQQAALASLLADENPAVYHAVRTKILSHGADGAQWIRSHILSEDPVLRRRAREIVRHFARQAADNELLAFCLNQGEDLDIEEAAWLLARTQYPEINTSGYRAWVDQIADTLRERIDYRASPEEILGTLNHHLFKEIGFTGNEKNYYSPDNSYLNRVLDRHTGNPINLALVYILIARRLHLPIVGIGMPGHFLCRFQTSTSEIYIDVFNRGKLLTKGDCVKYLLQSSHSFQESHLAPVTPRRMLLRICMNLHHIYLQANDTENVSRIQRYLVALSN